MRKPHFIVIKGRKQKDYVRFKYFASKGHIEGFISERSGSSFTFLHVQRLCRIYFKAN